MSSDGAATLARHALEHLASSDRGVVLFRRRLHEAIAAIERGEDPPGVSRDSVGRMIEVPSRNDVIDLHQPA